MEVAEVREVGDREGIGGEVLEPLASAAEQCGRELDALNLANTA